MRETIRQPFLTTLYVTNTKSRKNQVKRERERTRVVSSLSLSRQTSCFVFKPRSTFDNETTIMENV